MTRGLLSPSLVRLRLLAVALAVLAAALFHAAPPARAQALGTPEAMNMQRMHLGFYLWWVESSGATGYDIQIRSQSGGTWGAWSDVAYSGTTQPAIVDGLTHDTNYQWRIRATKAGVQSGWTTPVEDSRDTRTASRFGQSKPNPPILRSAVAGQGQVTVTWEPGPERTGVTIIVTAYEVYYRWRNEDNKLTTRSVGAVSPDTRTVVVTELTPGVEYQLWVAPWVGNSKGAGSNVLLAAPEAGAMPDTSPGSCNLPGSTPPGLPAITAFTPTHNGVSLYWNSPVYGTTASGSRDLITDFLIWVTAVGGSYSDVMTVTAERYEPATYQHTISGLDPATTCQVSLSARTITACYSGWSSVLVTTNASMNQHGWRLGVIELPRDEPLEQQGQQHDPPNQAPTVAAALGDVTIADQTGTHEVPLSGTFSDADGDALAISAASSHEAVATVSVAADYSTLTVSAQARGTAVVTVTADDGNGGMVSDTFTVRVKAAPQVASALADITGLEVGATRAVSLSGVFSDADGDSVTVSATSDANAVATVSMAADHSSLAVTAAAEGTATITVVAEDADGNRVIEDFAVTVEAATDTPAQSATVARYDANDDGTIDVREYRQAARDYVNKKITYSELLEVIRVYLRA